MSVIPKRLKELLNRDYPLVRSIKTGCLLDKSLCDGFVDTYYSSNSISSTTNAHAPYLLRNNPLKSIVQIYMMVYLQERPFHVEITGDSTRRDVTNQLNLFINKLFDKIKVSEILTRATLLAIQSGLHFIHYDILSNGIPLLSALNPLDCIWDQSTDRFPTDMSSCTFFAFQTIFPFSAVKNKYNRDNLVWQEMDFSIGIFANRIGAISVGESGIIIPSGECKEIRRMISENQTALPENRKCLITTVYERITDEQGTRFKKMVIFNSKEIIYTEDNIYLMPVIPIFISPILERRSLIVSDAFSHSSVSVVSPIRQLIVSLSQVENTLFRATTEHYPVRIANISALDSSTVERLEDRPDFAHQLLQGKILKTTNSQKATDAFSILYPPVLDPSLLTYWETLMNSIYQYSGVSKDLLGDIPQNRQETDSLYKSRNKVSIQRIEQLLDRCITAINVLAYHFACLITFPKGMRKMARTQYIIEHLTGDPIDPTEDIFEWTGLYDSITISVKPYYDTTAEIMNISAAKLVEGGFLDPRIIARHVPWLDPKELEELAKEDQQSEKDKNSIEEQKTAIEDRKINNDYEIRQLDIAQRSRDTAGKLRVEEMKILTEILLTSSDEQNMDKVGRDKVYKRFMQLLHEGMMGGG